MEGWIVGRGLQNDGLQEVPWVDVRGNKESACASLTGNDSLRMRREHFSQEHQPEHCQSLLSTKLLHTVHYYRSRMQSDNMVQTICSPSPQESCIQIFRPLISSV